MKPNAAVALLCGGVLGVAVGCGSSAGSTGQGGSSGSTGEGGSGAAGSGVDAGGTTPATVTSVGSGGCTFTLEISTSPNIPTVGIVAWSTTLTDLIEAHVSFGLDASYGMTAPVDLSQTSYRTLLLGMKASRTYHFQVAATNAAGTCTSGDLTLATGPAANGLTPPTITTNNASALYGGFLVTGQFTIALVGGKGGAPAFILDKDGAIVWWYAVAGSDATGVTMSYDGNYMWINGVNVPAGTTHVHRVSMDGLVDEDHSSEFTGLSHQLTVLPDETVAFYAYGSNGCDDIKLRAPDGTVTTVVNARTAHGGTSACHVNGIFYSRMDDTLVFSDLDNNCLTKVTRSGQTVWVLNGGAPNGPTSSFSGGAVIWKGGEHGFHILGLDDFVIFNNNSKQPAGSTASWGSAAGDEMGSLAIEVKLDLGAMTATETWSYQGLGLADDVLGDVQRLPNGNTLIDFATKGTIEEVDASGNVLQQIKSNTNFGYFQKRATLYGPPPR
ncbi:MAG TPA: aryl-sulfate sulfotransferase [Polyangia bacterium]|nr:aryl-sulfate sulfotransferase [Polyangia bacterium]